MNEWELVAAYARGDEQAFETLVRKYFPLVYAAAVRQLSDTHLAKDVAQSVFIIFARKAASLKPGVLLTGWFLRTTAFVIRDLRKHMHRQIRKEHSGGHGHCRCGRQHRLCRPRELPLSRSLLSGHCAVTSTTTTKRRKHCGFK